MKPSAHQEDEINIQAILLKLFSKWYIIAFCLVISIIGAYLIVSTSPKIYEVYSILKMNVGSSKSEKILNNVDVDKRDINIEDKVIEIKSTSLVREAINQLDFNVSYFTKGELMTRERYKLDFPVTVKVDSNIYNLTNLPIFIKILSKKEFELEYEIDETGSHSLYKYAEDLALNKQFLKQVVRKKFLFDKPIQDESSGLGFTVSLTGDPQKYENDKLFFTINDPNKLTKKYLAGLELETADRNSNILYFRIGSNILQKEKQFLNTLMDVVISKNKAEKNLEALKTIDFIDFQLANVSTSLNKAEDDLETIGYATSNIGESTVLFEQRNQLESQIANYNVQLRNLRNFLNNFRKFRNYCICTWFLRY